MSLNSQYLVLNAKSALSDLAEAGSYALLTESDRKLGRILLCLAMFSMTCGII